jgi:hypothetical protein
MEKFDQNDGTDVYEAPVIEDYGTLQELTASGGGGWVDVPQGTPVNGNIGNVVGSTP